MIKNHSRVFILVALAIVLGAVAFDSFHSFVIAGILLATCLPSAIRCDRQARWLKATGRR